MENILKRGFVKGHDFSHADKVNRISRALAPGPFPFTSTQLCQQSAWPFYQGKAAINHSSWTTVLPKML
jgi:hypothetical protein